MAPAPNSAFRDSRAAGRTGKSHLDIPPSPRSNARGGEFCIRRTSDPKEPASTPDRRSNADQGWGAPPPTLPKGKGNQAVRKLKILTSPERLTTLSERLEAAGAPMTPNHFAPLTDTQKLGIWASEALTEGRYELAKALTDLALQSHRVEQRNRVRNVPLTGQTREEAPARQNGPTGNGDADLARETALAETAVFSRTLAAAVPPETRRCVALEVQDGVSGPCHGVLYWQHGSVGDDQNPPTLGIWKHVHEDLDHHHDAKPALS